MSTNWEVIAGQAHAATIRLCAKVEKLEAERDELLAALKQIHTKASSGVRLHTPGTTYTNRFLDIEKMAAASILKCGAK